MFSSSSFFVAFRFLIVAVIDLAQMRNTNKNKLKNFQTNDSDIYWLVVDAFSLYHQGVIIIKKRVIIK